MFHEKILRLSYVAVATTTFLIGAASVKSECDKNRIISNDTFLCYKNGEYFLVSTNGKFSEIEVPASEIFVNSLLTRGANLAVYIPENKETTELLVFDTKFIVLVTIDNKTKEICFKKQFSY